MNFLIKTFTAIVLMCTLNSCTLLIPSFFLKNNSKDKIAYLVSLDSTLICSKFNGVNAPEDSFYIWGSNSSILNDSLQNLEFDIVASHKKDVIAISQMREEYYKKIENNNSVLYVYITEAKYIIKVKDKKQKGIYHYYLPCYAPVERKMYTLEELIQKNWKIKYP